jgi:CRISPR-associated protein Csd1
VTILQALDGYYERLAARGDVPSYGYSREKISYAIVLSPNGEPVDVHPLFDSSAAKPRHALIAVPRPVKRASGVAANFLWDKTSYVLGVSAREGDRIAAEHAAFRTLHEEALAEADDAGLVALRRFLAGWTPERFEEPPFRPEMLDLNLVFRLDGERGYLHDRPAARHLVAARAADAAGRLGPCLVTGEVLPIARLHPAIKGVQGAQTSGASIVSFNLKAFESFGKAQGDNAPVSERAAFGYGTALNALLERGSRNRIRLGDATTVFWAEAAATDDAAAQAAEELFALLADPPTDEQEAAKVAEVLTAIAQGRPLAEAKPAVRQDTRFYVLGLSPNASRLSVRFWHADSIGALARRIGEHWRDLRIEPQPWKTAPAIWRLLYETAAQRKAENIPPLLAGALMTAVLTGGRYPRALLSAVIMRMRADREVNGLRAALCRACLARDHRLGFEKEDAPVSLNPDEPNAAYRLGRLFAILESAQRAALGNVNATIRDRYFGAASATPASIFPTLIRNAKNHLKVIRGKRGARLADWFDVQIGAVVDGLNDTGFPRSLRMEDQGRFAIGYYHQREALHRAKSADAPADLKDADLDDSNDEA